MDDRDARIAPETASAIGVTVYWHAGDGLFPDPPDRSTS